MEDFQIFEQQPLPVEKLDDFFKKTILVQDAGGGWINAAFGSVHIDENNRIVVDGRQLQLRSIRGKTYYLESNLTIDRENSKGGRWEYMLTGNDQSYPLYTNYKDLPSDVNLTTELLPEHGDQRQFEPLTRERAMTVCMRELIKAACRYDTNLQEEMKKGNVIVYTGHPSSEIWGKAEIIEKFRKIAENAVKEAVPEAQGITCMTFPESRAAVFYAREKAGVTINNQTPVLVIDMGASTIDLTLIIPNRLIQRDASISLGGRDIDAAFMNTILEQNGLTQSDLEPGSEMALSFCLRGIKEEIYAGGVFKKDYVKEVELSLKDNQYKTVHVYAANMEVACTNIGGNSFISSLKAFLYDFLQSLEEGDRNSIQLAVVTGGTANVSHAREAVREVMQSQCAGFKQMIPLIGKDDTNGAVALGGLYLMKNNLQVYNEFNKLVNRLHEALVEKGMLSDGFKYRLTDEVHDKLLTQLYKDVYVQWTDAEANESLKDVQDRCDKFYRGSSCKRLMRDSVREAIRQEVADAGEDTQSRISGIFDDFFAELGIEVDSEARESIQNTVRKYLENCTGDLTDAMSDCIQKCNAGLNLNLHVIDDSVDRVLVFLGGTLNTVRNIFSSDSAYTQPRYQHKRVIFSDYNHNGKALKTFLADKFRAEVDGILKEYLTKGKPGTKKGEHLQEAIIRDIQPLLRNAIFMAR